MKMGILIISSLITISTPTWAKDNSGRADTAGHLPLPTPRENGEPIPAPGITSSFSELNIHIGSGGIGPTPDQLFKKYNQAVDAIHDLVTFGEHGRQRDSERAAAAEREAQQAKNSAADLKDQKKRDLQELIDQAKADVADWEDIVKLGPTAAQQLQNLVLSAQNELNARTKMAANLRAFKNANDDATATLKVISQDWAPAPPNQDADKFRSQIIDNYSRGRGTILAIAQNANTDEGRLLTQLLADADEVSLHQFISNVGQLRAQMFGVTSMAQQKLQAARARQANYESQLAALH